MPPADYEAAAERAAGFIRDTVDAAGAKGAIFGLSGGIDSAVVAHLCRRALGGRCLAVVMPNAAFTPDSETDDAALVAGGLGLESMTVPIGPISDLITAGDAGAAGGPDRLVVGNLNARIRAVLLYYEGQKRGYLVVGTDDRSEYLIGYFTKYGDGASDLLPIADLYKTEVRGLAAHLGVPRRVIEKPSGPHLWAGHDAPAELGMEYGTVDRILRDMQAGGDAASMPERLGVAPKDVRKILDLNRRSEHKRNLPPILGLRDLMGGP